MSTSPFSNLSTEELQGKLKSLKTANVIFIAMLIVMALLGVAITMMRGFGVFTLMPVFFLPMAVINAGNIKKIQAELASR